MRLRRTADMEELLSSWHPPERHTQSEWARSRKLINKINVENESNQNLVSITLSKELLAVSSNYLLLPSLIGASKI